MAGSQKNRPVDPDIEDATTFEDRQNGRLHDPVSVMFDNVSDLGYTIKVDGVPATNLTDEQIFKAIEELARFMDKPLQLHPEKSEAEIASANVEEPEEYTEEQQQTDFAHMCLDYVLKRDMPEAVVNVEKVVGRVGTTIRIIGEF